MIEVNEEIYLVFSKSSAIKFRVRMFSYSAKV